MSEEKLYAVKNDEGKYWDFNNRDGFWPLSTVTYPATSKKKFAKEIATIGDGHVVTLIEEPEKVVLIKEQAEIVENACYEENPATYISEHTGDEEELLMNAYVNGYTMEKDVKD